MLKELTSDSIDTQIENIYVAADILRRMLAELESLEGACTALNVAMCIGGHAIRQQLRVLSGIADALKSGEERLRNHELCQRAKLLISRIASELEQLSLQTEHDLGMDPANPVSADDAFCH